MYEDCSQGSGTKQTYGVQTLGIPNTQVPFSAQEQGQDLAFGHEHCAQILV